MPKLSLICLDFDGTFMVYDEPPGFMHEGVVEQVNRLGDLGIAWCANSGRDMGSQLEVLALSCKKGLRHMPVGLLACESLIFEDADGAYLPLYEWNAQARRLLRAFHEELQGVLAPHIGELMVRYKPEQVYLNEEATAFLIPSADQGPDRFFDELKPYVDRIPHGALSRNGGWVAALPRELGKGPILKAFATHRGIPAEEILAIGDHINDLSMLDGSAAGQVGCPQDAWGDVREAVSSVGGIVAGSAGPLGTMEILECYG
jgi:hypothetical protein